MHAENSLFCMNIPLGSPSADADPVPGGLMHVPRKWLARKIYLINGAAIAQSDTDLAVVKLKDEEGNVIASWSTASTGGNGALVKDTPVEMVLDTAYAGYDSRELASAVEAGTCSVEYDETDSGTAVALTSAVVQVWGQALQTAGYEALA